MWSQHAPRVEFITNLLLLDPGIDVGAFIHDITRACINQIEYFISVCERNPKAHPVPVNSMCKCYKAVFELAELNTDSVHSNGYTVPSFMTDMIAELYENFDMAPNMCEAAEASNFDSILEMFFGPEESTFEDFPVLIDKEGNNTVNTKSKQTEATDDWSFEGDLSLSTAADLMNIWSQDYMYGAYDKDTFVNYHIDLKKVRRIARKILQSNCTTLLCPFSQEYPGAGTQTPVMDFLGNYIATFQAPLRNNHLFEKLLVYD